MQGEAERIPERSAAPDRGRRRPVGWLLAGALAACAPGPPPSLEGGASGRASAGQPAAELTGVVFEGYRAGERDVELHAARAWVDLASGRAQLAGVKVAFGGERGPIALAGDRAQVDLASEDFTLDGQVRGSTGAGESFATEKLQFDESRQRLFTRTPVRVERGALTLEGQGMELDLRTQSLRFQGGVEARSQPREAKP